MVSPRQVATLIARSPHNIAHVESCPGDEETRYAAAAALLEQWEQDGLLRRDESPAYYVYEQRAMVLGERVVRRSFFARMRLYPPQDSPADNPVRPHEATMAGPRAERLNLQRATAANISPIMVMFADRAGEARGVLAEVTAEAPDFQATDAAGNEHRLWVCTDVARGARLHAAVAASHVTIADGHHRYATALSYLAERGGAHLAPEAAERWVLAGLVAEEEPGLVVLSNHRLIRGDVPADLLDRLAERYTVEELSPPAAGPEGVLELWRRVDAGARGLATFGLIGAGGRDGAPLLHLLTARSQAAIEEAMPAHRSPVSGMLDVLVLTDTILTPLLSIDEQALTAGERVAFTEDVRRAWEAVEGGEYQLALLVNPTRVEQIVAVADAGELLPQKATFFYPKLATGMVINRID